MEELRKYLYDLNPRVGNHVRLQEVVDLYGWDRASEVYPEIKRLEDAAKDRATVL